MTEARFDIVFRGDIAPGTQLQQVKQNLMRLFKIDEAKVQGLFSGQVVVLKRDLDGEAVEKYQRVLLQAGALVEKVAGGSVTPGQGRVRPEPKPKKMSLAERLAAEQATQSAAKSVADNSADESKPTSPAAATGGFSLAPVGSDLLQPAEKAVVDTVDIDTSAFSLREPGGELLDANEKNAVVVADLPDLHFDLAEPGADLLRPSERPVVTPVSVAESDWGIAAAGEDLGQIKTSVVPVVPDISHLQVENNE